MQFTILGMGRTGHTMACYLLSKGQKVKVWDRNRAKLNNIKQNGIQVTGVLEGHFNPETYENINDAIQGSKYILVHTVATGHKPVAELLRDKLEQGQVIIVLNCNWGAWEFSQVLESEVKEKNIVIGETNGIFLMSPWVKNNQCFLKTEKKHIGFATIPAVAAKKICHDLQKVFPQFNPLPNVLTTSLTATNPVIHVPINLFNLSAIEKHQEFLIYKDGATLLSVSLVEKVDQERLEVLKKIGIEGESTQKILETSWGQHFDNLLQLLKGVKSYQVAKGPDSFEHRHFTEDIPFGLVPIQKLGQKYNVSTPTIDMLINTYTTILRVNYVAAAPNLETLNIADLL